MKKIVSVILILILVLTSAFCLTSCSDNGKKDDTSSYAAMVPSGSGMEYAELGKGKTKFKLEIVDAFGYESTDIYYIKTNKKYLGNALLELELIKGEKGQHGLYVDTVIGITLDNKKEFWAFYVNGKQAQTASNKIEIKSSDTYTIKREKIK